MQEKRGKTRAITEGYPDGIAHGGLAGEERVVGEIQYLQNKIKRGVLTPTEGRQPARGEVGDIREAKGRRALRICNHRGKQKL